MPETIGYLCYKLMAPDRSDRDAVQNVCLCRGEKEKNAWLEEMKANAADLTIAKVEGKEDRYLIVDEFGLNSELVVLPACDIMYR